MLQFWSLEICFLAGLIVGVVMLKELRGRFRPRDAALMGVPVALSLLLAATIGVIWIIFWIVLSVISSVVPVLGWIVGFLISIVAGLGGLILWLLLIYKAYQGQEWELPIAGPIARKQMGGIRV